MNYKGLGRALICLLLIFTLLINISPIKAEATTITGSLVFTGAATINVPVAIAITATLVCLGIVGNAFAENPTAYHNLVSTCQSHLEAAGTFIKDGTVEMIQCITDTGEAIYYASNDFLEGVRSWMFDSGTVVSGIRYVDGGSSFVNVNGETISSPDSLSIIRYQTSYGKYEAYFHKYASDIYINGGAVGSGTIIDGERVTFAVVGISSSLSGCVSVGYQSSTGSAFVAAYKQLLAGAYDDINFADGITLGKVLSVPIDGTSARTWSEEYSSRGLYVYHGSSGSNGSNGRWFWPLALGLTVAELWAMSQSEQWSGKTPQEFDDYTTSEELTVTPAPEFDGYQSIELAPATNPDPGVNPGTGGESGGNTGADVDTDYTTWFQKVVDWLESIWEAITNIPDAIVNGIKTILQELFVPDPDFIPNKVAALQAQYSFLEPMQQTGEDLKLFFQNIGSQPPIIWIDLGAGTGWYPMGGKVKFIDLTWYSQYKPTADFIVGGSIWLWLAWRMFKAIPGIISGDSGSVGAPVVAPDISFNTARLPVGRSRRKKDGE